MAELESLVSPGRKLEERITELTGINDEMLADAPAPEKVVSELLSFIGEDIILGHSVMFDYSFVKRAAVNLNLLASKNQKQQNDKFPNQSFAHAYGLDTLKISRCFLPELESRRLTFLCNYYQIPHKAHRAVEDAKATVMLYEKLVDNFSGKNADDDKIFAPFQLVYQVKHESPASPRQKERLYKLIEKHKIVVDYDIDRLTRNEASRMTDKIILKYGRT